MARQNTKSNSNNLVEKFKDFLMDWYIERTTNPIEIIFETSNAQSNVSLDYPKPIYINLLTNETYYDYEYFTIYIKYFNNHEKKLLINKKLSHHDMSSFKDIIENKIPCNTDPYHGNRVALIVQLFIILQEWLKNKSGGESSIDFYPWENGINKGLFDFEKIFNTIRQSDFSVFLPLLQVYEFWHIPPVCNEKHISSSEMENLAECISDAIFTNKIFLDQNILNIINEEIISFDKKVKSSSKNLDWSHSEDYATVNWKDKSYIFSPMQAAAVKLLDEAYESGTPNLNQASILTEIDSNANNLKDIFHDGKNGEKAWKDRLIISERKGIFRINR